MIGWILVALVVVAGGAFVLGFYAGCKAMALVAVTQAEKTLGRSGLAKMAEVNESTKQEEAS